MLKGVRYFIICILVLVFSWFVYNIIVISDEENSINTAQIKEPSSGMIVAFTWDVVVPWWSISWESISEKNDFEKEKSFIAKGNFISFSLPDQPSISSSEWQESVKILREYLKNNNRYFSLNKKIITGYLYIKTQSPANAIFMYRQGTDQRWWGYPISGKLWLEESKIGSSSWEYLFDLKNIPLITNYVGSKYSFNRQEIIPTLKTNFVWWYVISFDGNKIEKIVIAWE